MGMDTGPPRQNEGRWSGHRHPVGFLYDCWLSERSPLQSVW